MKFEDHCKRTKERTGFEMPEVHRYLDQYFPLFRSTTHWIILHHQKGVEKIINLYGDSYGLEGRYLVRIAAEGHIKDDMNDLYEEPTDMMQFFVEFDENDKKHLDECITKEFS